MFVALHHKEVAMVLSLDVVPTGDIPTGTPMLVGLLVCILLMAVIGGFFLLFRRPDKARETPRMTERFSFPSFNEELAAARIRIREEWRQTSVQQPSTAESQARRAERRRSDRENHQSSVLGAVRSRLNRLLTSDPVRAHELYEAYRRMGGYGTLGDFEKALDACCEDGLVTLHRIRLSDRRRNHRVKAYCRPAGSTEPVPSSTDSY